MGEKGNVAGAGSAGVVDHVTAGFDVAGSTAGEVAKTVVVGVATTIATEEAQAHRAKDSDATNADDEGKDGREP